MDSVMKNLSDEKQKISQIEAPDFIEHMFKAVPQSELSKNRCIYKYKFALVISIIFILTIGINFNLIRGNILWQFNDGTGASANFEQVYENGFGQLINKSYSYEDGVELVVDSLFLVGDELVVLYRTIGETAMIQFEGLDDFITISGDGYYTDQDHTWYCEGRVKFKPVMLKKSYELLFQRSDVKLSDYREFEQTTIHFDLDYDRIITNIYEQALDETVLFDGYEVTLNSIRMSPFEVAIDYTVEALSNQMTKEINLDVDFQVKQGDKILNTYTKNSSSINNRRFSGEVQLEGIAFEGSPIVIESISMSNWVNQLDGEILELTYDHLVIEDFGEIYLAGEEKTRIEYNWIKDNVSSYTRRVSTDPDMVSNIEASKISSFGHIGYQEYDDYYDKLYIDSILVLEPIGTVITDILLE